MDDALLKALKRRDNLQAELEKVERFISAYKDLFGTDGERSETAADPVSPGENMRVESASRPPVRARRRIRTSDIADIAERVLRDVGRPMQRGELVEELERRDVDLPSDDKPRYLGTILWRNGERFRNLPGLGYWLQNAPLPEAHGDVTNSVEADDHDTSEQGGGVFD